MTFMPTTMKNQQTAEEIIPVSLLIHLFYCEMWAYCETGVVLVTQCSSLKAEPSSSSIFIVCKFIAIGRQVFQCVLNPEEEVYFFPQQEQL